MGKERGLLHSPLGHFSLSFHVRSNVSHLEEGCCGSWGERGKGGGGVQHPGQQAKTQHRNTNAKGSVLLAGLRNETPAKV